MAIDKPDSTIDFEEGGESSSSLAPSQALNKLKINSNNIKSINFNNGTNNNINVVRVLVNISDSNLTSINASQNFYENSIIKIYYNTSSYLYESGEIGDNYIVLGSNGNALVQYISKHSAVLNKNKYVEVKVISITTKDGKVIIPVWTKPISYTISGNLISGNNSYYNITRKESIYSSNRLAEYKIGNGTDELSMPIYNYQGDKYVISKIFSDNIITAAKRIGSLKINNKEVNLTDQQRAGVLYTNDIELPENQNVVIKWTPYSYKTISTSNITAGDYDIKFKKTDFVKNSDGDYVASIEVSRYLFDNGPEGQSFTVDYWFGTKTDYTLHPIRISGKLKAIIQINSTDPLTTSDTEFSDWEIFSENRTKETYNYERANYYNLNITEWYLCNLNGLLFSNLALEFTFKKQYAELLLNEIGSGYLYIKPRIQFTKVEQLDE